MPFLSQKFANTRSTNALRDSAAVHESQPTPATLVCVSNGERDQKQSEKVTSAMWNFHILPEGLCDQTSKSYDRNNFRQELSGLDGHFILQDKYLQSDDH